MLLENPDTCDPASRGKETEREEPDLHTQRKGPSHGSEAQQSLLG
jgi:hypothetical protein